MNTILRISEAASLAIHAMMVLGSYDEEPIRVAHAAQVLDASEAHLSKVFQRLARVDLVRSRRGPKGGFNLARAAQDISLLEIYEAIDGPIAAGNCLRDRADCRLHACVLGDLNKRMQHLVRDYLIETTLADAISKVEF